MRTHCNFITIVGLNNDERCLINNNYLHVEKHWRFKKIMKMFSNT